MNKVAYITANTPFGTGETFINSELLTLNKIGVNLIIIPRDVKYDLVHKEGEPLIPYTLIVPWFNLLIAIHFLAFIFMNPVVFIKLLRAICVGARNIKISFKNLIIVPKALYCCNLIKDKSVSHIHAHWGSTTSTMAYIISVITNIPWSFTLHRWDIYENNILKEKVGSAAFVRCISEKGRIDLLTIVGPEFIEKVKTIHMGVEIPSTSKNSINSIFEDWNNPDKIFAIAVPAHLYPVKGHEYLIEACSLLLQRGFSQFKCLFYGEGHLDKKLNELVIDRNLEQYVSIYNNAISHEELMSQYRNRDVDIVILPSIITEEGEHEGIPVALMEAMAYAIPVISTHTGSIPELLSDGAGILVKDKSPGELADAIYTLTNNRNVAIESAEKGYQRVKCNFSVLKSSEVLLKEFSLNTVSQN